MSVEKGADGSSPLLYIQSGQRRSYERGLGELEAGKGWLEEFGYRCIQLVQMGVDAGLGHF